MKNRLLFGFLAVVAWPSVVMCDAAAAAFPAACPEAAPAVSPADSFVSVAPGHEVPVYCVGRLDFPEKECPQPDSGDDGVLGLPARRAETPGKEPGLPVMTFLISDGSLRSVPATGLSMSFADGNLLVRSTGSSFEIPVSDLVKFYFSDDMSSVDSFPDEAAETVMAYSPSGVFFGCFTSGKEAARTLPSGLYILKSANRSSKIVIK